MTTTTTSTTTYTTAAADIETSEEEKGTGTRSKENKKEGKKETESSQKASVVRLLATSSYLVVEYTVTADNIPYVNISDVCTSVLSGSNFTRYLSSATGLTITTTTPTVTNLSPTTNPTKAPTTSSSIFSVGLTEVIIGASVGAAVFVICVIGCCCYCFLRKRSLRNQPPPQATLYDGGVAGTPHAHVEAEARAVGVTTNAMAVDRLTPAGPFSPTALPQATVAHVPLVHAQQGLDAHAPAHIHAHVVAGNSFIVPTRGNNADLAVAQPV